MEASVAAMIQQIDSKSLGLSIKVKLAPAFFLRARIATAIIRLAGLVSPIDVDLVEGQTPRSGAFERLPNGAPRRYSVGQLDYDHEVGLNLRVFLDGVEQRDVVAYDVDADTVTLYRKGADDLIVIENQEAVTDDHRGVVTVQWRN